jgi:hypothetical protein
MEVPGTTRPPIGTDPTGSVNTAWQQQFAVFAGASGTVTLGDRIALSGMQFVTDGYVITGSGANVLAAAPDTILRVSTLIVNQGVSLGNLLIINNASLLDNAGTIAEVVSTSGAQLFSGSRIGGDLNLGTDPGSRLILDGEGSEQLSQAVSGIVIHRGSLVKQGSGTWTIDKNLTSPVSAEVIAGVLEVNSALTTAELTVNSGATLAGSGNVIGNIINNGLVSPGTSPGILTITGNYDQSASGSLEIEIASLTSFDQLRISGTAPLDGQLGITLLNGYVPDPGDTFTIIQAAGEVSGTFSLVQQPDGAIFLVEYNPNTVVLLVPESACIRPFLVCRFPVSRFLVTRALARNGRRTMSACTD